MNRKNVCIYFFCFILLLGTVDATHYPILIIGCGRSGTTYMAAFLEKSGYKIKHEHLGNEGIVSWPMTVNFINHLGHESNDSFEHTFHQVRHPLHVITSWVNNLNNIWRPEWVFIRAHLPEINSTDSYIVHCAKYWYYWNLLAEKKAEWSYRVENLEEVLPEFIERSGLILDVNVLNQIPKNHNTWRSTQRKVTWTELQRELPADLYRNIREMTERYGYEPFEER